jgi:hypothetical protein
MNSMNGPTTSSETFFFVYVTQLKDMEMCGEEWRIEEDNTYKKKNENCEIFRSPPAP